MALSGNKDMSLEGATDFSQKWMVLIAVMTGGFMVSVDGSVVNLILPTLIADLKTDFTMVQWVMISYLLIITSLVMIMGRLGDLYGKKKVYITGFVIFTLGSLLCGLAGTAWWLIIFRTIQGIGGAMVLALGFAIATEAFPPVERGKAMGILASVVSLGLAIGPVVGGMLVEILSWRWIFFINLPIGLFGSYMVNRYVSANVPRKQTGFDLIGAIFFFLSMLSLVIGLTLGQNVGFVSAWPLGLCICSVVCVLAFVFTESRVSSPIVDVSLFRNMLLSVNLSVIFLYYFALSGVFVLVPFYFQDILGFSPDLMGLLFGCMSVMMILLSPVSGILSDKFGTSVIICISLAITAIAYLVFGLRLDAETTITSCVVGMLWIGTGMGLYMSPSHSAVMGAVPKEHLGVISSLLILCRTLGQTAGVAVLGAIWVIQTQFHSAEIFENVMDAPVGARIYGLRNIAILIAILTVMAMVIVLFAAVKGTKRHQ